MSNEIKCKDCGLAEQHSAGVCIDRLKKQRDALLKSGKVDLQPLKDVLDRDWKDETPQQIVTIAANGIYWRTRDVIKKVVEICGKYPGMGEFKLRIWKQVHGCFASVSSMDIWLKRDFELPFAPFIGLTIVDGDNEFKIETELCWETELARFVGYAEEDKEIYHADLKKREHRPVEEIAKEWEKMGWEREPR